MKRKDLERIIENKQYVLNERERSWETTIRHMECGEIRELKQLCIDDEIIIECIKYVLAHAEVE